MNFVKKKLANWLSRRVFVNLVSEIEVVYPNFFICKCQHSGIRSGKPTGRGFCLDFSRYKPFNFSSGACYSKSVQFEDE